MHREAIESDETFITEPSAVAPDPKVNFGDICRWIGNPLTFAIHSDTLIPPSGATALGSVITACLPIETHIGKLAINTLIALPPMISLISSSVNPSAIRASVICARPVVSNGSITAPSKSDPSAT
jgi:hypothetical protein